MWTSPRSTAASRCTLLIPSSPSTTVLQLMQRSPQSIPSRLASSAAGNYFSTSLNRNITHCRQFHDFNTLNSPSEAGPDSWTNADFNGEVPASCCVSASENATLCAKADAYELGCTEASQAVINSSQMLVYGVIMVVVIFQIICAIMAHLSKSGSYNRDRRCWCLVNDRTKFLFFQSNYKNIYFRIRGSQQCLIQDEI